MLEVLKRLLERINQFSGFMFLLVCASGWYFAEERLHEIEHDKLHEPYWFLLFVTFSIAMFESATVGTVLHRIESFLHNNLYDVVTHSAMPKDKPTDDDVDNFILENTCSNWIGGIAFIPIVLIGLAFVFKSYEEIRNLILILVFISYLTYFAVAIFFVLPSIFIAFMKPWKASVLIVIASAVILCASVLKIKNGYVPSVINLFKAGEVILIAGTLYLCRYYDLVNEGKKLRTARGRA